MQTRRNMLDEVARERRTVQDTIYDLRRKMLSIYEM